MDEFHRKLAQTGLEVAAHYGFALAGGHAVNVHGFLTRPSADVDLFGALDADLATASAEVVSRYRAIGLAVTVEHESKYYVRLTVADPDTDRESKVELVADIRLREPVRMAIGPVLHPDDVAAGKIEALFSRAECRDFIDVDALLRSGRFTRNRLLALAEQRDAGFDRTVFAQMLVGIGRFPDAEFARYDISPERTAAIRAAIRQWHDELLS
ncbi:MAG: nucleotidyl transferase AbiEii/AbiGii toxin family protein [Actinocrinis sp.]